MGELLEDKLKISPFKEVVVNVKCTLLPSSFEYPIEAVKQQLNELLFRFNYELQGVPICYSSISFPKGKQYGRIINEQPHVHIDISTKLTIFQPDISQKILGKITKQSESHVALLLNGMFNASISAEELTKKYKFNHDNQTWEHSNSELSEGDSILFRVKDIRNARGVFYIEGALK